MSCGAWTVTQVGVAARHLHRAALFFAHRVRRLHLDQLSVHCREQHLGGRVRLHDLRRQRDDGAVGARRQRRVLPARRPQPAERRRVAPRLRRRLRRRRRVRRRRRRPRAGGRGLDGGATRGGRARLRRRRRARPGRRCRRRPLGAGVDGGELGLELSSEAAGGGVDLLSGGAAGGGADARTDSDGLALRRRDALRHPLHLVAHLGKQGTQRRRLRRARVVGRTQLRDFDLARLRVLDHRRAGALGVAPLALGRLGAAVEGGELRLHLARLLLQHL